MQCAPGRQTGTRGALPRDVDALDVVDLVLRESDGMTGHACEMAQASSTKECSAALS